MSQTVTTLLKYIRMNSLIRHIQLIIGIRTRNSIQPISNVFVVISFTYYRFHKNIKTTNFMFCFTKGITSPL